MQRSTYEIRYMASVAHSVLSFAISASLCWSSIGRAEGRVHEWAGNQWLRAHEAGHIPEPPDIEAKISHPFRNLSVAMCAAMKAENTTDVREWLLYYRCSAPCTRVLFWSTPVTAPECNAHHAGCDDTRCTRICGGNAMADPNS